MSAPLRQFDQFGLSRLLLESVRESGLDVPSQIQTACIPPLLAGRDVLVQAPSGSGKTLAYVLPLLERLDPSNRQPQVLVLTPNHEQSLHVAETFQRHAGYLADFHVQPLYDLFQAVQLRQLQRGAQVLVGEPRRVVNHLESACFEHGGIRTLVLDEADEMLRGGFAADLEWLLARLPTPLQIVVLSAGLSDGLRNFVRRHLRTPRHIRLSQRHVALPSVRQLYWPVAEQGKLNALTRLLEVESGFNAALVFARSRSRAAELARLLCARGYAAAWSDPTAAAQRPALARRLAAGEIDILVGTDTLADDLNLDRITHAISYDMPCDAGSYVRRLLRLGRGGLRRKAILLVAPREIRLLRGIERATRQRIPALALPERGR